MFIYVVKPGDSIYSISRIFGVPASKIISDNELVNPDQLVVGQTLVILDVYRRHTVLPGQSLYTIALIYRTSVNNILAANPQLGGSTVIYPGQVLLIPPSVEILGTIYVNGYAYPGTDMNVLQKTFPHLTFLSIFSYNVNPDGSLVPIDDTPLIAAARQAGVAPLMVITNKGFNSDVASSILHNAQDVLLNNVLQVLRSKNYYGLDIDFEYVYPTDKEVYNDFIRKASRVVKGAGFSVSSALAPKVSATQAGTQYTAHDYPVHGRYMDRVIIMTYEWGYTYGPPMPVSPVNEVRKVLDYAVTAIPPEKILMGIPNYGYDWTLPFKKGTAAVVLSNVGAVELAFRVHAAIQFDWLSQTPYFTYYDENKAQHIVWFEDARSIRAKLLLPAEYKLGGVSYWTIGKYFPQNWLVQKSMYNVRKVI